MLPSRFFVLRPTKAAATSTTPTGTAALDKIVRIACVCAASAVGRASCSVITIVGLATGSAASTNVFWTGSWSADFCAAANSSGA